MRTEPIGQALRNARIAAGMEVSDVAAHLRIRTNFLAALEDGRADAMPGVTYAIGYVRTYSAFLGLDPEDAVKRFKQEAAGLQPPSQLSFPSPAPEGKVPGAGVMVAAAVLATIAYAGWYVLSERGVTLDDIVPAVPERLAELITSDPALAPQQIATAPATETSVTPPVSTYAQANPDGSGAIDRRAVSEVQAPTSTAERAPDAVALAQPTSTQDIAPAPAETSVASEQIAARPSSLVSTSEAAVPSAPEIPAAPGVSTSAPAVPDTGVVVHANGDSWVQIKDSSGNTLFTRVLNDGDFYQVPNQRGLTLDTGNAGTLNILVDGKAIPTLGGFGDVVRNISLDPAALKQRKAAESTQTPTSESASAPTTGTTPSRPVQ